MTLPSIYIKERVTRQTTIDNITAVVTETVDREIPQHTYLAWLIQKFLEVHPHLDYTHEAVQWAVGKKIAALFVETIETKRVIVPETTRMKTMEDA